MLQGVALGFVGWWLVAWLAAAGLARGRGVSAGAMWSAVQRRETEVPWLAIYLTALVLALIAAPVALLTTKYHVLGTDKVEGVEVERTRVEAGRAVSTGEAYVIPASLVV